HAGVLRRLEDLRVRRRRGPPVLRALRLQRALQELLVLHLRDRALRLGAVRVELPRSRVLGERPLEVVLPEEALALGHVREVVKPALDRGLALLELLRERRRGRGEEAQLLARLLDVALLERRLGVGEDL